MKTILRLSLALLGTTALQAAPSPYLKPLNATEKPLLGDWFAKGNHKGTPVTIRLTLEADHRVVFASTDARGNMLRVAGGRFEANEGGKRMRLALHAPDQTQVVVMDILPDGAGLKVGPFRFVRRAITAGP